MLKIAGTVLAWAQLWTEIQLPRAGMGRVTNSINTTLLINFSFFFQAHVALPSPAN